MSPSASETPDELIRMVRTLADVKASAPRKLRGVIKKEYGVDVHVHKTLEQVQYTAFGGKLMPDLVFNLEGRGGVRVRSYKPGDWEVRLKKAYDDLVAQSGAFGRLSIRIPEPKSAVRKEPRPPRRRQPQKDRGFFRRLLGKFFESED